MPSNSNSTHAYLPPHEPNRSRSSPAVLKASLILTPPLSPTNSTDGLNSIDFVARVSAMPLAETVLRAYEQIKSSSSIIKCGTEIVESSVKAVLGPVVSRLPITQLNEFACKQLDKFGFHGNTSTPLTPEGQTDISDHTQGTAEANHLPSTTMTLNQAVPVPKLPSPMDPPTIPPTPALTPIPPNPEDPSLALDNPFYPDPPPWYRPQTYEPGKPRFQAEIIGGLVIPREEGWKWWNRAKHDNHEGQYSQDLTIVADLSEVIEELGYPYTIELAQRRYEPWCDFLVVTQWVAGPFLNVGPTGILEVVQANLKDILKAGKREEDVRELMFEKFGITTTGFKCFFA